MVASPDLLKNFPTFKVGDVVSIPIEDWGEPFVGKIVSVTEDNVEVNFDHNNQTQQFSLEWMFYHPGAVAARAHSNAEAEAEYGVGTGQEKKRRAHVMKNWRNQYPSISEGYRKGHKGPDLTEIL